MGILHLLIVFLLPANRDELPLRFYVNGLFQRMEDWWFSDDEVVLDPTRLTLFIGRTGINGDTFKVKWLMDKYDIQVNKTSRNSVLFQTNIGVCLEWMLAVCFVRPSVC